MLNPRSFFVLFSALLSIFSFAVPAAPDPGPVAVMAEFDRQTASELWPGFDPKKIRVEIFDGRQAWLFRHPKPPEEFNENPEHPGLRVYNGRHPSIRSNTNIETGRHSHRHGRT